MNNTDFKSNNTCDPAARLSHLHLCAIWQDHLLKFGHFALMKWYVKKHKDIKISNLEDAIFMHLDRIYQHHQELMTEPHAGANFSRTSDHPNKIRTEINFSDNKDYLNI